MARKSEPRETFEKLIEGLQEGTLGPVAALELSLALWDLNSAAETGDDAALWGALARLGIQRRPPHRPKNDSDATLLRHCQLAATVQILSSVTTKTEAVRACASGVPASESVVWAACKTVGTLKRPEVFADELIGRVRVAVVGDPLSYSEELRQFLEVTR